MAGSYEHLLHGVSLIENMHDAGEAIEELFWLVESEIGRVRAKQLLNKQYYPMLRGERQFDTAMKYVRKRMER